ncbi:MAG: acyl-CoA carboxylase epsilon subunit [Ilumatobacteraceae bacterium]
MSPTISPVPTDEEAAAIVAAIELLSPRPAADQRGDARRPPVWRFSGRWWTQPIPLRRGRPWM